jgi:16S rRNA (cytidine1402-2'-O)-methyltransferase
VRAAIAAGFRVEAVPGACAAIVALAASGLSTEEFHFAGFLPHKSGQRAKEIQRLASLPGTIVLYESPYRIEKLLAELASAIPDREIVVSRELTKKFEEFWRGTAAEVAASSKAKVFKGEFVVLIAPEEAGMNRPAIEVQHL